MDFKKEEIKQYAIDRINELKEYDIESFNQLVTYGDLHNEIFNTDYYIIGEELLNDLWKKYSDIYEACQN